MRSVLVFMGPHNDRFARARKSDFMRIARAPAIMHRGAFADTPRRYIEGLRLSYFHCH
jgi:hypothetical protein